MISIDPRGSTSRRTEGIAHSRGWIPGSLQLLTHTCSLPHFTVWMEFGGSPFVEDSSLTRHISSFLT